ncbi:MAG: polysaccharide deacetylase family protein, partial [Bacteroidales bacterium]|nr:polysaccharide deacetylase family protein [Bacteroidales bacterium]
CDLQLVFMQIKPPYLARLFFPQLLWDVNTAAKEIFLTFDDGPHPEITPRVLEILDEFDAKATFFCVGENVKKHPATYASILEKGHQTGNHSYHHLNGWKTKNQKYFDNVAQCRELVKSKLFRPPFGKIKPSQIQTLQKDYKIVMWSVLSRDFDKNVSAGQCLKNVIHFAETGSVVVFHDSEKAATNLFHALPVFLEHFKQRGFVFSIIPSRH